MSSNQIGETAWSNLGAPAYGSGTALEVPRIYDVELVPDRPLRGRGLFLYLPFDLEIPAGDVGEPRSVIFSSLRPDCWEPPSGNLRPAPREDGPTDVEGVLHMTVLVGQEQPEASAGQIRSGQNHCHGLMKEAERPPDGAEDVEKKPELTTSKSKTFSEFREKLVKTSRQKPTLSGKNRIE